LSIALGIPLATALVAMLRRVQASQQPATVIIPPDIAVGLSALDGVLVHRATDGGVRVFSGTCTHLGCRIDRVVDDEAVCPCHGSRYRADGTVAAGPANRPLRPLRLEPDPGTGGWVARVS
jgi:Rieske Fe-S protein